MLNASRRRCCLHRVLGVVVRLLRKSAQRLTASLLSALRVAAAGAGRVRQCSTPHGVVAVCTPSSGPTRSGSSPVLNASRRRCRLHPARRRPREPAPVLNASRRRCCLHGERGGKRVTMSGRAQRLTASLLSAPTPFRLCPRCQTCAQRLTASLLSALPIPATFIPKRCVLNASRRRCCLHAAAAARPAPAPWVLNASRRRCCLHWSRTTGASTRASVLNASRRRCCLHPCPRCGCRGASPVLNASRRRCCLHTIDLPTAQHMRKCSTPHGVVAVCTRLLRTVTLRTPVLNASRRRCCLHRG